MLLDAPITHIALENPVGAISTEVGRPSQTIQPWMFGHGETKRTCLWLKNLPLLVPTAVVDGRESRVHRESPGPDRWKRRSRMLQGMAVAMADQWGGNLFSLRTYNHGEVDTPGHPPKCDCMSCALAEVESP